MKAYFLEHVFPYRLSRIGYFLSRAGALIFMGFSVWLLQRHVNGTSWDGDDLFRAVMAAISAALMVAPLFIHMRTKWRERITGSERGIFEILLAIMLAGNGIGALGFYRSLQYYDMALHFFYPILSGVCVAILLHGLYRQKITPNQLALRTISTIAFLVLLWEGYEWSGDTFLGTQMLGQEGEQFDTVYDVLAGMLALVPIFLISKYIGKKTTE